MCYKMKWTGSTAWAHRHRSELHSFINIQLFQDTTLTANSQPSAVSHPAVQLHYHSTPSPAFAVWYENILPMQSFTALELQPFWNTWAEWHLATVGEKSFISMSTQLSWSCMAMVWAFYQSYFWTMGLFLLGTNGGRSRLSHTLRSGWYNSENVPLQHFLSSKPTKYGAL